MDLVEIGDVDAQCEFARLCCNKASIHFDLELAIEWYKIAAKNGSYDAKVELAYLYYSKSLGYFNPRKALIWFIAATIQKRDREILFRIGEIYEGCYKDYSSAIPYYKEAAQLGYVLAYSQLGDIYLHIKKNKVKAFKYFKEAVKNEPLASYILGILYKNGEGFEQNYSNALRYFKLAAEAGCEISMFELGELYYNGYGVTKDFEEAAKWYQAACKKLYTGTSQPLPLMNDYLKGVEKELPFSAEDESFVPFLI